MINKVWTAINKMFLFLKYFLLILGADETFRNPTPHSETPNFFPRRCNPRWAEPTAAHYVYDAGWETSIELSLWTRLRTIFLLKGGLPGRPRLPASCMSFLSNVAGVCQLRKHRAICGCWKRSPWPAPRLRDGLLFPGMSHILSEPR